METTEITIRRLTPAEGMWLTQSKEVEPGKRIFSKEIYLSITDSVEHWKEISDEEKRSID